MFLEERKSGQRHTLISFQDRTVARTALYVIAEEILDSILMSSDFHQRDSQQARVLGQKFLNSLQVKEVDNTIFVPVFSYIGSLQTRLAALLHRLCHRKLSFQ